MGICKFIGMLTIVFIGLKLTDHISWSWWWVLSPPWISISGLVVAVGIGGIVLNICQANKKKG